MPPSALARNFACAGSDAWERIVHSTEDATPIWGYDGGMFEVVRILSGASALHQARGFQHVFDLRR